MKTFTSTISKGEGPSPSPVLEPSLEPLIVPNPPIPLLNNSCAPLANPPERLKDGRIVVQIKVREAVLDGVGGDLGLVVRDGRVEVVGDVRFYYSLDYRRHQDWYEDYSYGDGVFHDELPTCPRDCPQIRGILYI